MPRAPIVAAAVALLQLDRCSAGTAFLIIDVQDCFLENLTTSGAAGSLAVPASHIIEKINQIREEKACLFDKVVLSQDFHPANHVSFGSTHGLLPFSHLGGKGNLPLTCITPATGKTADGACCPTIYVNSSAVDCSSQLCPPADWDYSINNSAFIQGNPACTQCVDDPGSCFSTDQAMWTDHCLQDGDSTFPPSLSKEDDDLIVQKGTNQYVDAYSAFMDNSGSMKTELDAVLKADGIDTLYVAGIATDVCVRWTVADALAEGGYTVKVITDATAAVGGNQAEFDAAIAAMVEEGATSITVADVLATECPQTTTEGQDTTEGQEKEQDDDDEGDDDYDEAVSAAAKALPAIALLSGAVVLAH